MCLIPMTHVLRNLLEYNIFIQRTMYFYEGKTGTLGYAVYIQGAVMIFTFARVCPYIGIRF